MLAPGPLTCGGYSGKAAMPVILTYCFAHEWLDAEDPEERGVVALVGIMGVLCVFGHHLVEHVLTGTGTGVARGRWLLVRGSVRRLIHRH